MYGLAEMRRIGLRRLSIACWWQWYSCSQCTLRWSLYAEHPWFGPSRSQIGLQGVLYSIADTVFRLVFETEFGNVVSYIRCTPVLAYMAVPRSSKIDLTEPNIPGWNNYDCRSRYMPGVPPTYRGRHSDSVSKARVCDKVKVAKLFYTKLVFHGKEMAPREQL